MNFRLIIVGLLAFSCRNSSSPAVENTPYRKDTVSALPTTVLDTTRHISKTQWRPQRFTVDLNNDQIADTIAIISSIGDTLTFDTLHITVAHFGSYTFHTDADRPWASVDDWFLDSNRNVLPTNRLFIAKGKLQSVLLLFGEISPAGYRDNFSIINIENGMPKMVLNQNERHLSIETPLSVGDLDGDGRLDFLYRQMFEYNGKPDTMNGKIGTYSPYFVYTIDSNCVLNRSLTTRYNKDHYVFAGFKYDESIEVFYPNDGTQPRLWKP